MTSSADSTGYWFLLNLRGRRQGQAVVPAQTAKDRVQVEVRVPANGEAAQVLAMAVEVLGREEEVVPVWLRLKYLYYGFWGKGTGTGSGIGKISIWLYDRLE